MKRMTFGDEIILKPNKVVQKVYFDTELVGYLYSTTKNFITQPEEYFESKDLTESQLQILSNYKHFTSETSGFYQIGFKVQNSKRYVDLYIAAKKIFQTITAKQGGFRGV